MFNTHYDHPLIVATLGPSSEDESILHEMLDKGLAVIRFNFSHGDHLVQEARFLIAKKILEGNDKQVLTFADLSGPKVRIGKLAEESFMLDVGETFTLTSRDIMGSKEMASVSFKDFLVGLVPGMKILLDDGKIELEVVEVKETDVVTKVLRAGPLFAEKGVNIPEAFSTLSSLTEKDKKDMLFAVGLGFDAVALSFVRNKNDILEARAFMMENGGKSLPIIAKLETKQAMHNLEEIIEVTDVVMVARGDLGVEAGINHVPMYQKKICEIARKCNKPVIVATQMLESMVEESVPTRAEISDVVTAVLDGASYVMLSDETTIGKHPVECIQVLSSALDDYKITSVQ